MTDDDPKQMALEVYRHEMKAGEIVGDLYDNHGEDAASEAMIEAFRDVLDQVESEEKAQSAASVIEMFARQLEDENMMRAIVEVAQESEYLQVDTQG